MRIRLIVIGLSLVSLVVAAPVPVRIILVGDSTTAPHNGWGPGFAALLKPDVTCVNLAKNGRSTSSYRAEGSWDDVMKLFKA